MELIYHVTTKKEWNAAVASGYYTADSLEKEGFIHCSKQHQVSGVLERYYQGIHEKILLTIDPSKLTARLIYEWAPSVNEEFPHVYGTINLDAVVAAEEIN